jgi:hypothetical protein
MKKMQVRIDEDLAEKLRSMKKNDGKNIEWIVNQSVRIFLKKSKNEVEK